MSADPRIAIYPGSFDPFTLGHLDIVERALRFCDQVIVAVAHRASEPKQGLFPVSERLAMIRAVFAAEPRVEAAEFQGLLVEFARARRASLVVRGLRGMKDFEYEFQMTFMNRALQPDVETVFLAPSPARSFISSSLVREIAALGGDVAAFVPDSVLRRLQERLRAAGR